MLLLCQEVDEDSSWHHKLNSSQEIAHIAALAPRWSWGVHTRRTGELSA